MPEIETSPRPHAVSISSGSSASTPGASLTRRLPARLLRVLARMGAAIRERAMEILGEGVRYEETTVPYAECEHCGDWHEKTLRCGSRAVGFCVNCNRRRLLNGSKCSTCGRREIDDVHFRWSIRRGAK